MELDFSGNQASPEEAEEVSSADAHFKTISDVQHEYTCIQTEPDLDNLIQKLKQQDCFCLDTETTGLDPKTVELIGFSFCWEAGTACYLPVNGKGCLPDSVVKDKLSAILTNPNIKKVGHNLKYDLSVLAWNGYTVSGPFIDTMILHSLVKPGQKHGMDVVAEALLGYTPVSIESLIGPKGKDQHSMKDVPLAALAEYAAEDADVTWQLFENLQPKIDLRHQMKIFPHLVIFYRLLGHS